MSKFFLVDRVKTVWEISKNKQVSVDFAFLRYYADMVNGKAISYNSGLDAYDFASDKVEWEKLTEEEQKIARAMYDKFIAKCYDDICAAWRENDLAAIDVIIEEYKAKVAVEEAAAEDASAEA